MTLLTVIGKTNASLKVYELCVHMCSWPANQC